MKNLRTFFQLAVCFLAVCISGSLNAQNVPVPLLEDIHDWRYETNGGGTQTIEVADASTIPAGLGIETDNVFKHTSLDISWDAWWWCGAIALNNLVPITENTKTLKFKVYTEMSKYYIVVKTDPATAFITLENVPVEPNTWTTVECDLSPYIGSSIERIELVPQASNQVIYVYPYFEDPAPKPVIANVIAPLVENMTEADFTFTSNNANTATTIVESAGLNVPDDFASKVFKVHTDGAEGWQFWWNTVINLNDAQLIPENENVVLVAKVFSPYSEALIMQKADDGTILNTAYNWGQRIIVPDQWNEIVMDYISPHRGWSFLQTIELATMSPGIDLYAYFYWATKNTTSIKELTPIQKNIKIVGNQIVVDGASDIKQYTVTGQLVNTSHTGFVPAMKGINIIVADGVASKVFYNGK
jgi:hypothetical protein